MASVSLSGGGNIVIVFRDKKSFTGGKVSEGDSQGAIEQKIRDALLGAMGKYPDKGNELDAVNASSAAAGIKKQLEAKKTKAAEPAKEPEKKEPPKQPERKEPAKKEPQKREVPKPAAKPEKKAEPKPEVRASKPQPVRDQRWVDKQLDEMWKDDKKAKAAADALYSNRMYVGRYLAEGDLLTVPRTDIQKKATVSVFNALWQIPKFQLTMIALTKTMPEFKRLYDVLRDPSNRSGDLSVDAKDDILVSADMFIRYYLFAFVASGNPKYREELNQMEFAKVKLANIDSIRSYKPKPGEKEPTQQTRDAVMRLQLHGSMDADTITAAALYMRRWNLEHPEKGKAKSQDEIPVWKAPAIIQPPEEKVAQAAEQPKVPAQVVPPAPSPTSAERKPIAKDDPVMRQPKIGIIGDSITEDGLYGKTLRRLLPQGTVVGTYGVKSSTTGQMRARFKRDIVDNNYNIAIISGGVNDLSGDAKVSDIEANISSMVKMARDKGMKVIIMTVTPWGGSGGPYAWNEAKQKKTDELNAWILAQAGQPGVYAVDFSSMGENNMLKHEFDEYNNRLHPSPKGKEEMGRLIAEQAFGVRSTITATPQKAEEPPKTGDEKSPLQKHADANWATLKDDLYNNVMKGNPAAIINLAKTAVPGAQSVEAGLGLLKRQDLDRAADRLFNEYLKTDPEFIAFCSARAQYRRLPMMTLNDKTDIQYRKGLVRAEQDFINTMAKRTDQPWFAKLDADLQFLYGPVMSRGRASLEQSGVTDLMTLSAFGVYQWRLANKDARIAGYAASVPGVKLPEVKAEQPAEGQPKKRTLKLD